MPTYKKHNYRKKKSKKFKRISIEEVNNKKNIPNFQKYIFPIKKFKLDENVSFSHFRSYITLFNYFHINRIKNKSIIKKYFGDTYQSNKYFDLFYDNFFKYPNPLIFTYYNNIPLNFFPYPEDFFYYFPYMTFYDNNKLYNKGNIVFKEKLKYRFIFNETFKTDKKEIQTTIPLEYFRHYKLPEKYFLAIKVNQEFITTDNIKFKGNECIIKNYFIQQKKITKEKRFKFENIKYVSVLLPITQKLFDRVFSKDIIEKGSIFYNLDSKEDIDLNKIWFTFFYPKIPPFMYGKEDIFYCNRIESIKDFEVLNLNTDIFYNNKLLENKIKGEYSYLSQKDTHYEKIDKNGVFRCINNAKTLKNRLEICNLTKKNFDFLKTKSWVNFNHNGKKRKNYGKDFLNILIFKNKLITEYRIVYYPYFLAKFNTRFFIFNYGYFFNKKKKKFYDTELNISDNKNIKDYFKMLDSVEGYCNLLYKKGKLLDEKIEI